MVMGESRPVIGPQSRTGGLVQKDPFNGPPKPYAFKYGVSDADTGNNYVHGQQQETTGVVKGT